LFSHLRKKDFLIWPCFGWGLPCQ